MRVRRNQNGLKLNGNISFLFILLILINVLGGSVYTIKKKKAEALGPAAASKNREPEKKAHYSF
jgi:hypothetical protein